MVIASSMLSVNEVMLQNYFMLPFFYLISYHFDISKNKKKICVLSTLSCRGYLHIFLGLPINNP
jgi:hypothetical protein